MSRLHLWLSLIHISINDIRERAGARLLTSSLAGTIDSRDIVRKERRKALAFEHKPKWDLRRWRVNHYEAVSYTHLHALGPCLQYGPVCRGCRRRLLEVYP